MIRYAEPGDAEAVAAVETAAWRAAYGGLLPDDDLAGGAGGGGAGGAGAGGAGGVAAGGEPGMTLVLEDGRAVVGVARLGPAETGLSGPIGEVRAVTVVPDRWGRGIGRRLLEAAVEELRWAGYGEAVAWPLEADRRGRRFLERAGWEADGGERADLERGTVLNRVRYRRPVPSSPYALRFDTAAPDDVDGLLRLYDDLARWMVESGIEQWRPGELPGGRVRHFIVDGEVTVLRYGDEIAGSAAVTWADPFAWNDSVGVAAGYVHQLMLARHLAGQGLGRRLLQRAEARIHHAGLRRVRLDFVANNDRLRRYYERAGYVHVGETDFGGRTDLRPCALYEKRITAPPAARA